MSYIFHEHSRCTSAIDKYWVFNNKELALSFYREMVEPYLDYLDVSWYEEGYEGDTPFDLNDIKQEILNNEDDITIFLTDDDYLVFSKLNGGMGRRP